MKLILALMAAMFLLSGCSSKILMPYESEPRCQLGINEGMCGSVSDVYKKTARTNYGE